MAVPTIRERVKAIQKQVLAGAFTPALARENLMLLTGLLGSVLDEHRDADHEYSLVLLGFVTNGEPANRAAIKASVTPEYARVREAKDTEKLVTELIRSSKVYLKSLDEEMRLAG